MGFRVFGRLGRLAMFKLSISIALSSGISPFLSLALMHASEKKDFFGTFV
jgi:hypothetical protein